MTTTEYRTSAFDAADALLITLLASGTKQTVAAEKVGVSLSTVRRRMATPEFRRAVEDVRNEIVDATAGNLANMSHEAADILMELARSSRSDQVKYLSARAVVELAKQFHDTVVLERRMAELEAIVKAGQNAPEDNRWQQH